jgi:3-hydroxybutyryl-CoA dehydrogenase
MSYDMQDIHTVALCGVGQMGAAAAVAFRRAGYRVLAWNHRPQRLAELPGTVKTLEDWLAQHTGSAPNEGGSIEACSDLEVLDEEADAVLDCIVEDMEQKIDLFKRLPGCVERNALFMTTTSGLSITEIGRRSGCGHLLAGTHFWNPPHLMPLVEVIRGEDTPDHVMDRVCQLVESIGKTPVRVEKDVPGFIGNRMLHALWREAISLVEQGIATPEDVDLVARLSFGLRLPVMGPLENMDLVGLDLIERVQQYLLADLADNHGPSEYLVDRVRQGNLGTKTGQGFYDWRSRKAEELVEKRAAQIVHQLKFLDELEETVSSPAD